jgi:hypothetical protein
MPRALLYAPASRPKSVSSYFGCAWRGMDKLYATASKPATKSRVYIAVRLPNLSDSEDIRVLKEWF